MDTQPNTWKCPNCSWFAAAHPTYGWQESDSNAVRVHQEQLCPAVQLSKATVILFKDSGKYYTEEKWRVPTEAEAVEYALKHNPTPLNFIRGDLTTPYGMIYSPDFRRIGEGKVLVVTQEPWGYPHLL